MPDPRPIALACAARLALGLAIVLPAASGAFAQDDPRAVIEELLQAEDRPALEARDARLSFTSGAADRALAALDSEGLEVEGRAAALTALGSAGLLRDLPRLESSATAGKLTERRAAVLALGRHGPRGAEALLRVARSDVAGLEEALVLGLAIAGSRGDARARAALEAWAAEPGSPLAPVASAVLSAARDERPLPDGPMLTLQLELRWEAARAWGFVDGRRWREVLLEALCADSGFLDRVVLTAATNLRPEPVRDHFFELVREGASAGALRAAVRASPEGLSAALEAGAWRPAGDAEWRAVLTEIDREHLARRAPAIPRLALIEAPRLRPLAGRLALAAGVAPPEGWLEELLREGSPRQRMALVEALGEGGDPAHLDDLLAVEARARDPEARAVTRVALARLGHAPAIQGLQVQLAGERNPELTALVAALARAGHDPRLTRALGMALARQDLGLDERVTLRIAAGTVGSGAEQEELRGWLVAGHGTSAERVGAVRLLGRLGRRPDVELLRAMFPSGDEDLDVELALALLRRREADALDVLRAALWDDSWNRSVLAVGLFLRATSVYALLDELATPPAGATTEDLRRIGFGLGQWGGLPAVESLARRRAESDPALQGAYLGALTMRSR